METQREPYEAPKLELIGTLADLTQNGNKPNFDTVTQKSPAFPLS